MKKYRIYKSIIFAFAFLSLAIIFTSCDKDFEEINTDPNKPVNVPNSYYLTQAQRGIMDNTSDVWWGANVGNQLAQYWSSNQYSSESRYQFRGPVTNSYWRLFYAGGLNDAEAEVGGLLELQRIIDNCTNSATRGISSASGDPDNQITVATILQVWLFQNMTDCWGDIPYSEALDPDNTRTPKYDSQSSIYSGLLSELNTALGLINTSQPGPSGDLIYGGVMSKWKSFGNALKMRVALRMADVDNATAQSAFTQAVTAGTFTSNSDNALLPYGEGSDYNLIYFNYELDNRNDYASSNIMLDSTLEPLADPRMPCFFSPADADTSWTGEVYGLDEGNAAATPNASVSQRSSLVLSASLPGIFMDYAQVEFMLAEAVARGWAVSGSAKSHYDAGTTASIDFWTDLNGNPATPGDISTYLSQAGVDYDSLMAAGQTWKQIVGKQKWIALYNQGIQGWTEWRRLDFGILQLPADGVLDGNGIPTRMLYAFDEQTLNAGNYSAAIVNQGPDLQNTKLWWDIY